MTIFRIRNVLDRVRLHVVSYFPNNLGNNLFPNPLHIFLVRRPKVQLSSFRTESDQKNSNLGLIFKLLNILQSNQKIIFIIHYIIFAL